MTQRIALLTVRALAEAIRPGAPEEELVFVTRRLRHWTLAGCLETVGDVNSGVGRHRRYTTDAIYIAAILDALADNGHSIEVLKVVAPQLRSWWTEKSNARDGANGSNGRAALDYALAGRGPLYLAVEVRLATGDPSRDWVQASLMDGKRLQTELERNGGRLPSSSVLMLNLTDVLGRVVMPEAP